jgi:hypothetical protein
MLTVLTVFSAAIVSVIKRGTVYEGIKTMPVFAIIAVIIYYVAAWGLHSMMGGIIYYVAAWGLHSMMGGII